MEKVQQASGKGTTEVQPCVYLEDFLSAADSLKGLPLAGLRARKKN